MNLSAPDPWQWRLVYGAFWLILALAYLLTLSGCQSAQDRYNESVWENKLFQQKLELQEQQAKGEGKLQQDHAKAILALTAHEQVALRAQSLSAKLEAALWILGISLALNLAGGFFLASIMPSLSVTLFKMAALCAALIGLDVAADFLLPYVVEYIGWAALAIPVAIAGVIAYEVKTHPVLLDFLRSWHLFGKAEIVAQRAEVAAGALVADSGTFPQQHAAPVAAESALSPKAPQRRKD